MARKKQNKELPPVSQLLEDFKNNPSVRLGARVIIGKDGEDITRAMGGDNTINLYAGRAPQHIIDQVLASYVSRVIIYTPKTQAPPKVLTSDGYGGRVVEQQRPYA